jgi:molybdenum cofactor synthesis domain-containing protein
MAEARHDHGRDGRDGQGHAHGGAGGGGPITVGILTCSDRGAQGERADVSGPTLHNLVAERLGAKVAQYKVVPDDRAAIEATLVEWADDVRLDLVFTTGGTGFSARDVTPEATRAVVEREAPALTQAMLFESLRITPYAMLTRATAGIRKRTLIVNLPGNPKAVTENFDAIAEVLPHAVDIVRGVDTHAGQAGHAGGHAGDAREGQQQQGHREHAEHGEHAGHREHGEHREHAEHAGHREEHQASEPAAGAGAGGQPAREGGIARNVGGPPC